mmetsp:Transcript_971/g.2771  ORF Transcript_971/g.2771 Transcript_971/m.2771 type:complete len:254 (-) Transcript_971:711-1472(-)
MYTGLTSHASKEQASKEQKAAASQWQKPGHVVDLQVLELRAPLVEAGILLGGVLLALGLKHQELVDLVDVARNATVQHHRHEQLLHLSLGNVELLADEGDADARVRLDELEQDLRAHVLEQVAHARLDKGVAHDGVAMCAKHLLKLANLVALVGRHKVGHRQHLRVLAVRAGLLAVKGVDLRLHEHVAHNQVLEALHAARHARLVVRLERLEEVGGRRLPLALRQVHLPTTLADDAHDLWVRDGRLDRERLVV